MEQPKRRSHCWQKGVFEQLRKYHRRPRGLLFERMQNVREFALAGMCKFCEAVM